MEQEARCLSDGGFFAIGALEMRLGNSLSREEKPNEDLKYRASDPHADSRERTVGIRVV